MSHVPLPNYLRRYRKQSCLSQREVAYLLGLDDAAAVGRHEVFERLPGTKALLAYRAIYREPFAGLFEGTYSEIELSVRKRAAELIERVHEGGQREPIVERKLEVLSILAYPEDPVIVRLWNESLPLT